MTITKTIPSYLYTEYSDDDDLQAFVAAYNTLAQQYVDWFNNIQLPVYTNAGISGTLLDWVAEGIYGMTRPSLPLGHSSLIGPYNTAAYNTLQYNQLKNAVVGGTSDPNYYAASDDVFKRILTWHFYKGDGKVFDIRWLKRRVMRFLNGPAGTAPNIDQTYQVSVLFGLGNQVNIRLLTKRRSVVQPNSMYNVSPYNVVGYNALPTTSVALGAIPLGPILASAINSGVLELPFQNSWVVVLS